MPRFCCHGEVVTIELPYYGKVVVIKRKVSYGFLRISWLANCKNRSFLSGQGVFQIQPNWVWSIPRVP